MRASRTIIARRTLVATAATGALGGLTAALATSDGMQTKQGFLGLMERWNERVQAGLLRPSHLCGDGIRIGPHAAGAVSGL